MEFYYPTGIILPFDTTCPTDWTEVTALNDKFVKGSTTYGGTGGSNDHKHTADFGNLKSGVDSGSAVIAEPGSNGQSSAKYAHKHDFLNYTGLSSATQHFPPYIKVVFCKKD